jgi:hypothetical protein
MAELQVLDEVSEEASHRRVAVTLADVRARVNAVGRSKAIRGKDCNRVVGCR